VFLVFNGKKLSTYVILANLIATIGLALLTIDFSNFSINIGDIIVLGTAVSIAIQILLTDKFVKDEKVIILTLSQFFNMALLSFIVAVIFEPVFFISFDNFSNTVWIALLVTVIFATIYAFLVQTFAQKDTINPSLIAIIFAFEPVFALIYSLFVGEETLGIIRLLGMTLILLATFIVIKKEDMGTEMELHHLAEL
jgi:drug/metabolite transporter (DMT)-like permease